MCYFLVGGTATANNLNLGNQSNYAKDPKAGNTIEPKALLRKQDEGKYGGPKGKATGGFRNNSKALPGAKIDIGMEQVDKREMSAKDDDEDCEDAKDVGKGSEDRNEGLNIL